MLIYGAQIRYIEYTVYMCQNYIAGRLPPQDCIVISYINIYYISTLKRSLTVYCILYIILGRNNLHSALN